MRKQLCLAVAVATLTIISAGCDNLTVQDVDDYVVEAYLIAGQQLPVMRLSESTQIGEQYDFTALALNGAGARVELLDSNGDVETTFPYEERSDLYWPSEVHSVLPGRTYRLNVDIPGESQPLTATTIVPGDFEILDGKPDSVLYQGDVQFEVNVTESAYPGRQAVYVFSVEALEPSLASLTPFYREVVDPDDEEDIQDVIVNESFVINEANFDVRDDGTYLVKLPWLAVAFYGPNNIIVNTIDDNMFDFLRSHTVQQGGSTFSPGEIPNVIDRVEGGTGVFASITRQSIEVVVTEREF